MNIQLIIAAIIAAASFGGGFGAAWKIQNGIAAEKENEYVQQTLRATQESAATAIRRADNVIAAQNAAALRERRLRADAASSRDALVGLSHATTSYSLRAKSNPIGSGLDVADIFPELFLSCSGRLVEVAGEADQWKSDAIKLHEAWPR